MPRKKVNFVATRQKNGKTNVSFYTKEGTKVSFDAVKKVPTKERITFYANTKTPTKR